MNRTFLVLCALMMVPTAVGQNTDPNVLDVDALPTSVDLIDDAGTNLQIIIEAEDTDLGDRIFAVEVTLSGPNTFILDGAAVKQDFNMDASGKTWVATLAVDDKRLLTGSYGVTAHVFDRFGGDDTKTVTGLLTVTATTAGHALRLGVFDKAGGSQSDPDTQRIGARGSIRLDAAVVGAPTLVRSVLVRIETGGVTGASVPVERPFVLEGSRFKEGTQTVHVDLMDRAGRSTAMAFDVLKDTVAPNMTVLMPAATYQGVNFTAIVTIKDASSYSLFAQLGEQQQRVDSDNATPIMVRFARETLGKTNMVFTAVDQLGNVATAVRNVTTVQAITDTSVTLRVLEAFPLPGEPVTFEMVAKQDGGVTTIPARLLLSLPGTGVLHDHEVALSIGGTQTVSVQANLRPGVYEANATISVGPFINETDSSDQTDLTSFEVFLGKVEHGDKSYYIRVDSRNQPTHAVFTGGAQYPLTLNQTTGVALYEFTVKGEKLHWDPTQRLTVIPVDEKQDEDSPGLAVIGLLGLLGAVAYARRRM